MSYASGISVWSVRHRNDGTGRSAFHPFYEDRGDNDGRTTQDPTKSDAWQRDKRAKLLFILTLALYFRMKIRYTNTSIWYVDDGQYSLLFTVPSSSQIKCPSALKHTTVPEKKKMFDSTILYEQTDVERWPKMVNKAKASVVAVCGNAGAQHFSSNTFEQRLTKLICTI